MRWMLLAGVLLGGPALAEGEPAGAFDYYILALSWSPSWCALEGDARDDPQCDPGQDLGFTLHGLWPQSQTGWPSWCRTRQPDPSRAQTAAMADIMGSSGLAWYQWKKHGRCAGLPPRDYFALARRAYDAVRQPDTLAGIDRAVRLPAAEVERAFLAANPWLSADAVTVTCDEGLIDEVRLCLTTDLQPRACAPDAARDCRLRDAILEPIR